MPVYNAAAHLREAIESILSQSLPDFEFLIVNDASTDGSDAIIREYCRADNRIRYLQNAGPKGASGALNTALDQARGTYVARMDADDISLPVRLERQYEFLERHTDIGVCGTNMELFGAQQAVWRLPEDHNAIRCGLLFTVLIAHATVMMRRAALEEPQARYDDSYAYAEDFELWSRLSGRHRFANVPDVLYRYRKYGQQDDAVRERVRAVNAHRVRLRLLGTIGITPSPAESELHQQLGDYNYTPNAGFVRRADRWLSGILAANERYRQFDQGALHTHIEERRAEIHGSARARGSPISGLGRSLIAFSRRLLSGTKPR